LAEGRTFPAPPVERSQSVAIVGGGPAGLSAACQLRRRGYRVTLFEAAEQLGGVMRHGIPSYQFDRAVQDGEVNRSAAIGIDIRLNVEARDKAALEDLKSQYDAVYLAMGRRRGGLSRVGVGSSQGHLWDSLRQAGAGLGQQTCCMERSK